MLNWSDLFIRTWMNYYKYSTQQQKSIYSTVCNGNMGFHCANITMSTFTVMVSSFEVVLKDVGRN